MAVKIRMMRIGRRHRPFFRINAIENRNQQKGRVLEKLGHYDPLEKDEEKQVVLDLERVKHWLDAGAVPTDAVSQILLRFGIKTKHGQVKTKRRERARLRARAEGKFFTKAEKAQAQEPAEDKSRAAHPSRRGLAAAEAAENTPTPETAEKNVEAQESAEDKSRAAQAAESAPPPEKPAKPAEAPETIKHEEVKVENKETDTAPEETVKPEPAPTPETANKNVEAQESAEDKSRAAQAAESAPPPETPENPDQAGQADEGDEAKAES